MEVRDLGRNRCGIVTFTHQDASAPELPSLLGAENINVSISSRSSTRIDMEARGLESLVRSSVHYYHTEEEVDGLVEVVKQV